VSIVTRYNDSIPVDVTVSIFNSVTNCPGLLSRCHRTKLWALNDYVVHVVRLSVLSQHWRWICIRQTAPL